MNALFVQTRRSRRKLIQLLQKQQELDSSTATLLKAQFLVGYRKLMVCVGEMLNEYGSSIQAGPNWQLTCKVSEEHRTLFARVCSDYPLDEWLALRLKEAELTIQRSTTQSALSVAQQDYDKVAPFGFLSKLGSSDIEKALISAQKRVRDSLASQLQTIDNEIGLNKAALCHKAEQFLRSATSESSITVLCNDSPIKDRLREILTETSSALSSVWQITSEAQLKLVRESQEHLDLIRNTYEQHQAASGPSFLPLNHGDQSAR